VNGYQPVVVCTGPSSETFEKFFGKVGICDDARFLYANGWVELADALCKNPCAVAIVEFQDNTEHLIQALGDFPKATVVGFTDDPDLAESLATAGFFDIVLGCDPAWRLVSAMRNAVKLVSPNRVLELC
jgi:hypothetical protein